MTEPEPVADWATDYDIFDTEFVADPCHIWGGLREGGCPVAHTERWGGSHMPLTFAGVSEVAHDAERFTSYEVSVTPHPVAYDEDGNRLRSIITSDDPEHHPERRLMLPFFSPKVVERFREPTRDLCRQLIRGFIEEGYVDAGTDYSRQIPTRVLTEILGIDPDRCDEFTEWVQGVLELGQTDPKLREKYRVIIIDFFIEQIAYRRENPGDDLVTLLINAELDGKPLPTPMILGNLNLMLVAGIDTTWSSIGSALWHLATQPEDRQRLVDDPELIPVAVEEFLRAYSPVTMARLANYDTAIGDDEVEVAKGDRVLLSFPAANRDPEVFDRPEEVIVDRAVNRHIAFGAGPHRCLGSNLARMEMNVAIEEFLAALPEFECRNPGEVTWAGGQVRGPRHLPIHFPVRSVLD